MNPLDGFKALWKPSSGAFLDGLTLHQRAVLSVLAIHSNGEGTSWPSLRTITKATGMGRSTVIRALKDLERTGLLDRAPNPPEPTRYTVSLRDRPGAGPSPTETETVPERDGDSPGAGPEVTHEVTHEVTQGMNRPGAGPSQKRLPPASGLPRENGRLVYPAEFEAAWTAYPDRAGSNPKRRAYDAFKARVNAGVDPDELLEGVHRYARFVKATEKGATEFVLQAATFFGPDERWRESWRLPEGSGDEPTARILR